MTYSKLELNGKVAVVVGGTSGIGRAIALGFAEAGADVVPTSRRVEQVETTAREIEELGRRTLRILRGAEPDALTCGEIGERLVSPGPDVTRLLDRLEERGLVLRLRDAEDRRVVRARITEPGIELLNGLDEPVGRILGRLLGPLGKQRLQTLVALLEEARGSL